MNNYSLLGAPTLFLGQPVCVAEMPVMPMGCCAMSRRVDMA